MTSENVIDECYVLEQEFEQTDQIFSVSLTSRRLQTGIHEI